MLKSLFPWKHNKTKATVAQQQMMDDDEVTAQDQELLPCHICGRTFLPTPLRKHERVCEKTAAKKRKPFDSLKQRVEGTELAIFHQKSYLKKPEQVQTPNTPKIKKQSNWKEKHLEFIKNIRAAKGVPLPDQPSTSKTKSMTSLMAGTERCPCCDRQFGPKAFDRHVEWCKEKKAQQRIHHSPANVLRAKERLEARTKYVPPLNKAKKMAVREKYSSHATSADTLTSNSASSQLSKGLSETRQRSVMTMGKNTEKLNNLEEKKEKTKLSKAVNSHGEKLKLSEPLVERTAPVIFSPSPKSESIRSVVTSKTGSTDKKKSLSSLKKSMTLLDKVPKPPSLKNKNDVNNYFSEQEQKISSSSRSSPEKEVNESIEEGLKPEDLFAVDDEMYEEYKRYEEMYLKEKEQQSGPKKQKNKTIDNNYGILTASEEEEHLNQNKLSNDSAYGSLTRKAPKHRSRSTKLTPLEQKQVDSTSSSGSEHCPNSPAAMNQRLSKFCHECGNKYPLTTAKFCVECGVRRLVL